MDDSGLKSNFGSTPVYRYVYSAGSTGFGTVIVYGFRQGLIISRISYSVAEVTVGYSVRNA